MVRIRVSREMDHPRVTVWEALADLGSHPTWMKDAESLVFTSDLIRGVGTEMAVKTVVGPFRTVDVMRVTGWEEGCSIDVEHSGLVQGSGRLEVQGDDDRSEVSWDEELRFPWWLGGPVTAIAARPALLRIWRGNLERLEETL